MPAVRSTRPHLATPPRDCSHSPPISKVTPIEDVSRPQSSFTRSSSSPPQTSPDPRWWKAASRSIHSPSPSITSSSSVDEELNSLNISGKQRTMKYRKQLSIALHTPSPSPERHAEDPIAADTHDKMQLISDEKDSSQQYEKINPRLRLYPFVLPPDLWDEPSPTRPANYTGPSVSRKPMFFLNTTTTLLKNTKPVINVGPTSAHAAPALTRSLSDIPILMNPLEQRTKAIEATIPQALRGLSPNSAICLSSLVPYPAQPSKMSPLVWLDAKTTYHIRRGGCITVRNHQGRQKRCFIYGAEKLAAARRKESLGHGTGVKGFAPVTSAAMLASRGPQRLTAQEIAQRTAVARALTPARHTGQRGPRGPRVRKAVVEAPRA